VKVVALEPKTHADVQRVMLKIGQLLEVPDAQRIWRAIDAAVMAAAQSLPAGCAARGCISRSTPGRMRRARAPSSARR
jgi:iron complex transport system substrate-binding protein